MAAIYLRNLPRGCDDGEIGRALLPYGEAVEIHHNREMHEATVYMQTPQQAQTVISRQYINVMRNSVSVEPAYSHVSQPAGAAPPAGMSSGYGVVPGMSTAGHGIPSNRLSVVVESCTYPITKEVLMQVFRMVSAPVDVYCGPSEMTTRGSVEFADVTTAQRVLEKLNKNSIYPDCCFMTLSFEPPPTVVNYAASFAPQCPPIGPYAPQQHHHHHPHPHQPASQHHSHHHHHQHQPPQQPLPHPQPYHQGLPQHHRQQQQQSQVPYAPLQTHPHHQLPYQQPLSHHQQQPYPPQQPPAQQMHHVSSQVPAPLHQHQHPSSHPGGGSVYGSQHPHQQARGGMYQPAGGVPRGGIGPLSNAIPQQPTPPQPTQSQSALPQHHGQDIYSGAAPSTASAPGGPASTAPYAAATGGINPMYPGVGRGGMYGPGMGMWRGRAGMMMNRMDAGRGGFPLSTPFPMRRGGFVDTPRSIAPVANSFRQDGFVIVSGVPDTVALFDLWQLLEVYGNVHSLKRQYSVRSNVIAQFQNYYDAQSVVLCLNNCPFYNSTLSLKHFAGYVDRCARTEWNTGPATDPNVHAVQFLSNYRHRSKPNVAFNPMARVPPGRHLYVSNLSESILDDDLKKIFTEKGFAVMEYSRKSPAYAILSLSSIGVAVKALIAVHGQLLKERYLRVTFSRHPPMVRPTAEGEPDAEKEVDREVVPEDEMESKVEAGDGNEIEGDSNTAVGCDDGNTKEADEVPAAEEKEGGGLHPENTVEGSPCAAEAAATAEA